MNKKVIYTCLVGNYDNLKDPIVVDKSFDYICFTNEIHNKTIGVWRIEPIPVKIDDKIRLSRYVKMMPHAVLGRYEYSLWMDANLQITGREFYDIVNEKIEKKIDICQVDHCFPSCDCVYQEMEYAYSLGRAGLQETLAQYKHLEKSGFPKHWGLYENNILLRRHNVDIVRKISEDWWKEYNKYTRRDQFSLVYVYWNNNFKPELLLDMGENSRNVPFLKWHNHIMKSPGLIEKILFHLVKYYRVLVWKLFFVVR